MGSSTDPPVPVWNPPPERWPDPKVALTIGDMNRRGWSIRATCDRCGTVLWCDTSQMVTMMGTEAFMWGRRGKCRVMIGPGRCHGRTSFEAKTPRSEGWYSLNGDLVNRAKHLLIVRTGKKAQPKG